ncbi:HAMP domain-containing protein [Thiopseudomonas alkaliphila]|uniref:histidine kinase n=1 Tax=Thiopseudomonas alkaliphila TaxID=1697053 RepID=A0AAW7DU45_9GAMM|nr:ATP-binding protein [Thiopseudomonas alkaliphila]MDM1696880.1 HAMP domain-containing protein [Thiopseudomonas alkaliphila]
MRLPFWFPQSFFARTLWMVLLTVLFSKALTLVYLMVNEDVLVDRQYSHGAALTLRAYWAAAPNERPVIAKAAGLQRVQEQEVPLGEKHWPYSDIFSEQMRAELGEETQVRIRAQAPPALWVHAPALGPDWVRVPLYPHPLRGQRMWNLFGWFLGIGLLSTGAAWIFVRHLSLPLKRLVHATRQLGQGRSVRLPVAPETASEMAEVYRAFNQMAEDVEQAGRERELMLAGVSHDLRTPLTRLRLSVELSNQHCEFKEDMVRDIEDMDAILDQFLAFIRDGRDEPLEMGNLVDLIKEVAATYNHTDASQEPLVRLCLEELPDVPLRRVSIKRLLVNLIENALRYGGSGVEVAASIEGNELAPYIAVSVLDRGAGIPTEEIESIFNPFIRGDAARGGHGAGLGLSIVKRIAQQHGGSVELNNRAGGGLEAKVSLPIGLLLPRSMA